MPDFLSQTQLESWWNIPLIELTANPSYMMRANYGIAEEQIIKTVFKLVYHKFTKTVDGELTDEVFKSSILNSKEILNVDIRYQI